MWGPHGGHPLLQSWSYLQKICSIQGSNRSQPGKSKWQWHSPQQMSDCNVAMLLSPLAPQWEANVGFVVHKLYLYSGQMEQFCSGGCVAQGEESLGEPQTHVQAAVMLQTSAIARGWEGTLQSGAGYGITNKNKIERYLCNTSVIL